MEKRKLNFIEPPKPPPRVKKIAQRKELPDFLAKIIINEFDIEDIELKNPKVSDLTIKNERRFNRLVNQLKKDQARPISWILKKKNDIFSIYGSSELHKLYTYRLGITFKGKVGSKIPAPFVHNFYFPWVLEYTIWDKDSFYNAVDLSKMSCFFLSKKEAEDFMEDYVYVISRRSNFNGCWQKISHRFPGMVKNWDQIDSDELTRYPHPIVKTPRLMAFISQSNHGKT